jgi:hypothetical protein
MLLKNLNMKMASKWNKKDALATLHSSDLMVGIYCCA